MRTAPNLLILATAVAVTVGCEQKRPAPPAPPPTPRAAPPAPQSAPTSQPTAAGPPPYRVIAPVVAATTAPVHQPPEPATTPPAPITVDSEPPDSVYMDRPAQPGPQHVWVRSYWDWSGTSWIWQPGAWRVPPTGLVLVRPYYELVGERLVFIRPYWAAKAPAPSFGGKRMIGHRPVAPAAHQPGTRYAAEPSIGFRPGTRPARLYQPAGPANLQVPPATK